MLLLFNCWARFYFENKISFIKIQSVWFHVLKMHCFNYKLLLVSTQINYKPYSYLNYTLLSVIWRHAGTALYMKNINPPFLDFQE